MIKFVKRSHYQRGTHGSKIIITYSASEVLIGFLLISLVGFYVYYYLETNLNPKLPVYNLGKVQTTVVPPDTTTKAPSKR